MLSGSLTTHLKLRSLTKEKETVNTLGCRISVVEAAKTTGLIAIVSTSSRKKFDKELPKPIPQITREDCIGGNKPPHGNIKARQGDDVLKPVYCNKVSPKSDKILTRWPK